MTGSAPPAWWDRLTTWWYRVGAWWSPGPLRPQGNPLQRWLRLRRIGRRAQARRAAERGEGALQGLMTVAMVTALLRPGAPRVIAAIGESFAHTIRAVTAAPCLGCDHDRREHSHVLAGAPCLVCDCGGFLTPPPP